MTASAANKRLKIPPLPLQQPNLAQPLCQERVGGDWFGVEIGVRGVDALRQRLDHKVRREVEEKGH